MCQVPENQRMNAEKKRRQMFLLEDRIRIAFGAVSMERRASFKACHG